MGNLGVVLLAVGLYNNRQHNTNTGDCDLQFRPYTADFFRVGHSLLNELPEKKHRHKQSLFD